VIKWGLKLIKIHQLLLILMKIRGMKQVLFILCCMLAFGANGQLADATEQAKQDSIRDDKHKKACAEQDADVKKMLAKAEKENAVYKRKLENRYGKSAVEKVSNAKVWLGMSDELCLYGLTEPNRRKTTYTKEGKTEVWVYQGQAEGCVGYGCPYLDYVITFKDHKAIAITTSD
jgi:hypothetical protein